MAVSLRFGGMQATGTHSSCGCLAGRITAQTSAQMQMKEIGMGEFQIHIDMPWEMVKFRYWFWYHAWAYWEGNIYVHVRFMGLRATQLIPVEIMKPQPKEENERPQV